MKTVIVFIKTHFMINITSGHPILLRVPPKAPQETVPGPPENLLCPTELFSAFEFGQDCLFFWIKFNCCSHLGLIQYKSNYKHM